MVDENEFALVGLGFFSGRKLSGFGTEGFDF